MKKAVCLMAGIGLSAVMLTGCGTPKANELVDKMYDAKMDSYTADASFDFAVTIKADSDMSVKANGDFTVEQQGTENAVVHADGKVSYDLLGFLKDSNKVETYTEIDGKNTAAYYSVDGEDWTVETSESAGVDIDADLLEKIKSSSKEFFYKGTVDGKTTKVSDVECYVLTIDGTAADFKPIVDIMCEESDELKDALNDSDVKFEDVAKHIPVKATMYVSKKDSYIMAADIDMSGIDIDGILGEADTKLEDLGSAFGMEIEAVTVDSLKFSMTYSKINETEVSVPKDVKDNAVEAGASFGSYDDFGDDDFGGDDEGFGDDFGGDSSFYTLQDYLEENNLTEVMASAMGDELQFEIYGNDIYFTMTVDDAGLSDDEIEEMSEALADAMDSVLEENFKDSLDQFHDLSGISEPFSVTFDVYGETTGNLVWSGTYTD